MADTRILIVVNDVEAGNAYTQALTEIGVAYDIVPSFHLMSDMAIENAYNGLIIDVLTLIRCSKEEKVIAYDSINIYPVLRVKWESRQRKIMISPVEQALCPNPGSALQFFIETRCRTFPPRRLRGHKRKQVHLNVLLSPDGTFSEHDTVKTFTVNLSRGGVFVHTVEGFEPGRTLWLRFIDLADQTPVAATVCRCIEWGRTRSIPGIGMSFQRLSEDQERELQEMC